MFEISFAVHGAFYDGFIPNPYKEAFEKVYRPSKSAKDHFQKSMREKIEDNAWRVYVAESNGEVVGYTLGVLTDKGVLFKHGLFVDIQYQGCGIGSRLLDAALYDADSRIVRLEVIKENKRAMALYERYGFSVKEESEKTFFGAPMWVMERINN